MRKLIIFLFALNIHTIYAQLPCDNYCLNFDDTLCMCRLTIDTINYSQNIWQIGKTQKQIIDTAYPSRTIITDTINPYPINNHSVFIIKNTATFGDIYGCKMFQGKFYCETDSLKDFGKIEFSPDNGTTWIDLINDSVYNASITWFSQKPVLTGRSGGCKYFDVVLADNGSVFNVNIGDTLLYRFTFISDSIDNNLNGLMFDDLCIQDFVEGISETHFSPVKSKIYPNPSKDFITIGFDNPNAEPFQLAIYDIHSRIQLYINNITENKITINIQQFKPGIYIYKLTNLKAKKRSWGKFITYK
ncbi:MAG TPA: T9SS type A sorting domain-containing protein [Bacteroidales bacterium]|nr:T9SS type A sorting domain-containing protein [Bacteroidales bacterium]HPS17080.1 T9SS type A sorting domain-containing protein [Bacteroidales bacterium]